MSVDGRIDAYLEFLSRIPRGTPIEVEWEDASESHLRFHPDGVDELKNIAVETTQHEIGWFLGVKRGRKWRSPYLIFVFRKLDGSVVKTAMSSIPLGWVRKLRVLDVAEERKARKNLFDCVVKRWHKTTIRFDGGVKHLR